MTENASEGMAIVNFSVSSAYRIFTQFMHMAKKEDCKTRRESAKM